MDAVQNGFNSPLSDGDGMDSGSESEEEDAEEEDAAQNFESLREELFSRLQSPQFTSKLKAQIRASLALQLAPSSVLTAKPARISHSADPLIDLANAICAQHLRISACDFSLSVFLPESGLNAQNHPMDIAVLMRFLRIKEDVFKGNERSFLCWLVERLPVSLENSWDLSPQKMLVREAKSVQTDYSREEILEERMQLLDMKRRLGCKTGESFNVEQAFDRYSSNVEKSLRASMRQELIELHQVDLARQKQELEDNYSRQLLHVTGTWESRLKEQAAAFEVVHEKVHLAEQETFHQRQQILQQQEAITQKETRLKSLEMKQRADAEEKEQELIRKAKQLAEYSQGLQAKEAAMDRLIEYKALERMDARSKSLNDREERLKKEEASLIRLKEHVTRSIINENGDLASIGDTPVSEPRTFVQKIRNEFSRIHKENQKLKSRLAEYGDYVDVKKKLEDSERERTILRSQINQLQEEVSRERTEHTSMVRELTERVLQPDRNLEPLRREAESLRERLVGETLRWDGERTRLKSALREKIRELENSRETQAQLEEKLDVLKSRMQRMQAAAQQAAWTVMQPTLPQDHHSPSSIYHLPATAALRFDADNPAQDSRLKENASLRSIAEAKKRIRALEEEATTMQQHFMQYRTYVSDHFNSSTQQTTSHSPSKLAGLSPTAHKSGLILNPASLQSPTYPSRNGQQGFVEKPTYLNLNRQDRNGNSMDKNSDSLVKSQNIIANHGKANNDSGFINASGKTYSPSYEEAISGSLTRHLDIANLSSPQAEINSAKMYPRYQDSPGINGNFRSGSSLVSGNSPKNTKTVISCAEYKEIINKRDELAISEPTVRSLHLELSEAENLAHDDNADGTQNLLEAGSSPSIDLGW